MLRAPDRAPYARDRGNAYGRFVAIVLRRAWTRTPRAVLIGVGVVLLLLVSGLLAVGPIVRHKVALLAERRGLDVSIGRVRPGFFAISLHDVRARPKDVPDVARMEARLDDVRVELDATFAVRSVEAHGGTILLEGQPEDLANRVRDLKKTGDQAAPTKTPRAPTPLSVDGLALSWKLPSGEEVIGTGIHVSRDGGAVKAGCVVCTARSRSLVVDTEGAAIELAPDGALRRVEATTVVVAQTPPHAATPAAAPSSAADLVPPPLPPPAAKKGSKQAGSSPAPAPALADGPLVPLPDLRALRARIRAGAAMLASRLPDGAAVDIAGLSANLALEGESVAFGPGAFTLTRRGDRVHVVFASVPSDDKASEMGTGTGKSGTPLSVDAEVPVDAGDVVARLAGGPVSLALLGVKEGTKGLIDVGRGTVEGKGQLVLADAADALSFDGHVTLRSIAIKQPKIAPEPVRGIDFTLSGRGAFEAAGKLRLDDADLDMGALHLKMHGQLEETSDHYAVNLGLDVAPAACQALLDSSPQGLLPTVRPSRMGGVFAASVNLGFDTRTIDKLQLDYRIDDQCRMLEVPRDLSRDRFSGSFTYRTYHPDGTTGETTTGPGSPAWTDLDDISPFMIAAVLTTEDGAFYKHHGFNHSAIRSSVRDNLKAGRFVRGASTITMQLAKNLFLARDKALSRKIEEVILTDYLEQILRKDELMELYLNIVEFGPDVYGITQAADYYFGRKPEELNLAECFFLATLLPSPLRYSKLRDKAEVPESWMRHLGALMEIAARNGKITRAEADDGLKEPLVFVREGAARPEPRKPITGARRDAFDEDAAWAPLN